MAIAVYIAAFVVLAIGFTALERALARRSQPVLRAEYATDLLHVVLSNSAPAAIIEAAGYATIAALSPGYSFGLMAHQPLWLQVLVILGLTDLTFYLVHRALHAVPALWRLHRIHHSPAQMDWLSGYRKHALETAFHSAVAFAPVAVLGFAPEAWLIFGIVGVFFAGFTHLNITAGLRWLEPLLVTPRYHAWHHATDAGEQRHNLAGKLTVFDSLFGTRRRDTGATWPATLGLDEPAPITWWPTNPRRVPRAERSAR